MKKIFDSWAVGRHLAIWHEKDIWQLMPRLLIAHLTTDIWQLIPCLLTARLTTDIWQLMPHLLTAWLTTDIWQLCPPSLLTAWFIDIMVFNICPFGHQLMTDMSEIKISFPICNFYTKTSLLGSVAAEIMLNFQYLSNIWPLLDISWWLTCMKLKLLPQYVIRW
jgi:hypothetical protein